MTTETSAQVSYHKNGLILLTLPTNRCILTFIGPVGVGKSTQMRLIERYLESKKIRTTMTYLKSSHIFSYALGKFVKSCGASEKVTYADDFRLFPRRDILRKLLSLWAFLDTLSIALKFFFEIYLPYKLGFSVLVEEGLVMTELTYAEIFPHLLSTRPKRLLVLPSLLAWVKNANHINIVLNADDKELDKRRKQRHYRQNELSDYVAMQKKWAQRLSTKDSIFIDTNGESAGSVHTEIIEELKSRSLL